MSADRDRIERMVAALLDAWMPVDEAWWEDFSAEPQDIRLWTF